jgi:imidazole glycerol-phosphate synthase subunit HisH
MIALIDYGAGNLTSVRKAFAALDAHIETPRSPEELRDASALIVPGVGHFGATHSLDGPWRRAIQERLTSGTLLFGICLGMQWLFEGSTEAREVSGLGCLPGMCGRLDDLGGALKVPHVGWNSLTVIRPSPLLEGVGDGSYMYFTHSYAAPVTGATTATTHHGSTFAAVVESGNVMGVQFHPEKSGEAGLMILRNFVRLAEMRTARASVGAPVRRG